MKMEEYTNSAERMMLRLPDGFVTLYILTGIIGIVLCIAAVVLCIGNTLDCLLS